MAVTILGDLGNWGIVANKPALPDGWKYIERPDYWLLAEDPDGELWYVDRNRIILCRRATVFDWFRTLPNYFKRFRPLKPGQMFADTRRTAVLFSQMESA